MGQIIDGKQISATVRSEVAKEIKKLNDKGVTVTLAVVLVGDDPASQIYVRNKEKACADVGIVSRKYLLSAQTSQKELLDLIATLNHDKTVNGILVQMPLPKGLDEKAVIAAICPEKDVDAFHPVNVGKIMIGDYDFLPCTPAGVMELIHSTGVCVEGKDCVVIGRSNIVGKPMSMLLLHESATVTICHSRTKNLKQVCAGADLIVSAVGKAGLVTADMVKDGAVVIDVGMNRDWDGKLCGDVCFDEVAPKTSFITPVPGGVGPMTIAMLMKNTLTAACLQNGIC